MSQKYIGGFFELELPRAGRHLHEGCLHLSTGRACLSLLISELRPTRAFVPWYSCDALTRPFEEAGVEISFYEIDGRFEIKGDVQVGPDDLLVYVNYFGIHREAARRCADRYPGRVVLDNTQAFFETGLRDVPSFNSARKFFGVPDGACLFSPKPIPAPAETNHEIDCTHLVLRSCGQQQRAFEAFQSYEASLTCRVSRMSALSSALLSGIDYGAVAQRRQSNFDLYHARLGPLNQVPVSRGDAVPFCYPFLPARRVDRRKLAAQGVFIPCFWPEVSERVHEAASWERQLAERLLPLPVDHRYGKDDVDHVLQALVLSEI